MFELFETFASFVFQTFKHVKRFKRSNNFMKYNFEHLEIYNLGRQIISEVYKLSQKFPKDETYGLVSQIKRAAVSVSLNIAEGSSRKSHKEFLVFIERSVGSLIEVKVCLEIACGLGYIKKTDVDELLPKIDELYFKLHKFKKYLRTV